MRKNQIAMAVAATLASGASLAANPTWDVQLVVAGSSAFRDGFQGELALQCNAAVTTYFGNAGNNPDLRGYYCSSLKATSGLAAGTSALVYYRSEGGSVFGVLPIVKGVQINRLNIGTSGGTALCGTPADCGVTETSVVADTFSGTVTKDTVQLGISDVEAGAFVGENFGNEYLSTNGGFVPGSAPSKAQLNAMGGKTPSIIGQVFVPIVNTGMALTGLTSQEIATIISDGVQGGDWSEVPSAITSGDAGTITLCRRDAGSGTQVITSTHFLGTNCSSGGRAYATAAGNQFGNGSTNNGMTINYGFSTSDVLNCVKNNANSIGFVALQTAAKYAGANAKPITVDGIAPTNTLAAQGKYTYYGEAYAYRDPSLTGNALILANHFITALSKYTTAPSGNAAVSLVAVPGSANPPSFPLTVGNVPIGVGTTGGNVCQVPVNQL